MSLAASRPPAGRSAEAILCKESSVMKPLRFCNVLGVFLLSCFGAAHMASQVNAQASVPVVATEAPTGFGRQTNGHTTQARFVEVEEIFARKAAIADGVGPV